MRHTNPHLDCHEEHNQSRKQFNSCSYSVSVCQRMTSIQALALVLQHGIDAQSIAALAQTCRPLANESRAAHSRGMPSDVSNGFENWRIPCVSL